MTAQYDREEAPGLCRWVSNQRKDLQKDTKAELAIAHVTMKKAELYSIWFVWDT